ncbi:hypothetical protein [Nocardioides speluncae]|uniref:hypothetical protein n=1 Tax=Nocardioides speluncae TaxID=2670337 RepID=UPI000D6919A1|nr:hypothetical protein [Nocardioides speluncae]
METSESLTLTPIDTEPTGVELTADAGLSALANLMQRHDGASLTVTLSVSGSLVTGDLVGRNTWLDQQHRQFADLDKAVGEIAAQLREGLRRPADGERDAEGEVFVERYVHLVNARYVVGGSFVPAQGGMFWRGRLQSVDGWSLGVVK